MFRHEEPEFQQDVLADIGIDKDLRKPQNTRAEGGGEIKRGGRPDAG